MIIHRTRRGEWRLCHFPQRLCRHRFHLPNLTVAEAEALPYPMLLQLLEIVDPPTQITDKGTKIWFERGALGRITGVGRAYDLPAIIWADGSMFWWRHADPHREAGKPAEVWADGRRGYYDRVSSPDSTARDLIRGKRYHRVEEPNR